MSPHSDTRGSTSFGPAGLLGVAIAGTVGMTLWMANRDPLWLGPLWGVCISAATAAAWVGWLVPSTDDRGRPWSETALGRRLDERLAPLGCLSFGLFVLALGASVGGYEALPYTILVALLCLVPPALRRPGLAVILLIALAYLPLLGTTGLWDPWETHYGDVAREILARNDWISLWWAQDKWFWSKPVLTFWLEALSMGVVGVDFLPDANPAHPEWAVRMPSALAALGALAAIYGTVRHLFGTRAAVFSTLVVGTMPQFFFIAHQAITDMPLVACITVASCCLLLVIGGDSSVETRGVQFGRFTISLQHLVLFLLILIVLPQVTYLLSRNLSFIEGAGLVAHPDRFLYGSGGNLGIPGNPSPRDQSPAIPGLLGQPFLQGLLWLTALGALAWRLRAERRPAVLYAALFYLASGLAFMAKGLPGIAIPGAAALFYLLASSRWSALQEGRFWVSLGVALVCTISMPWYLAMYVRHGSGFINRLLIHDHINRLAAGVHGDQGTIEYFATQLGYATFPWIALLPLAILVTYTVVKRPDEDAQRQAMLFLGAWFLSSFVLFSAMATKFHHYILPALVPLGVVLGIGLDRAWGSTRPRATLLAFGAALSLVLGLSWLSGDPRGVIPEEAAGAQDWVLQQNHLGAAFGALLIALLFGWLTKTDLDRTRTDLEPASRSAALGVSLITGACLLAFVGRDLSWATSARPQGYERLIHLFVYNYGRAWPPALDYRALLTGFAIAAAGSVAVSSLARWRPAGLRIFASIALLFCVWSLDLYMPDVAPHWSARELARRYYAERSGPEEPLLAWQMNWKGENFYTGNRVHVFAETDNQRIRDWMAENSGRRVYVLLERKRLRRFQKLAGKRALTELSTERENNKFVLVTLEI
jgi:4-amino-4-deoxy-L-arabinose transferase-like glycosyltransferase